MPRHLMIILISILFVLSWTFPQADHELEQENVVLKESGQNNDDPITTWNRMMNEYSEPKTTKQTTLPSHAARKQRLRVISDVHIGSCWSSTKNTQNNFVSLLRDMAHGNSTNDKEATITHLVLLGDLFDWWVVPLTEPTPHPTVLFNSHDAYGYDVAEIISLIKQISEHTKVYLVRGNHDDVISKDLTKIAFGDSVQFMEDGFELDGVWLEHGNIIDLYSNPPRGDDKVQRKGFAYFVTRAGADEDGWQCKRKPLPADHDQMVKFARKAQEFLVENPLISRNRVAQNWYFKNVRAAPQHFAPTHLQGVLELSNPSLKHAKLENIFVTGMSSRGDQVLFDSNLQNYTLDKAVKDHSHDLELWAQGFGSQHTLARVYASGFENHFKWAPMSQKHLVLVTGHTHNPYIARLPRTQPRASVSDDVIYVNSGSFAQDSFGRDHSSFIDIIFEQVEQDQASALAAGSWRPQLVKYFEYPDNKPREELVVPIPRKHISGFDLFLHPDQSEMVIEEPSL